MFGKLQTRLLLTLISIAIVALAIVALFAMWETRRQFDAYVARDQVIVLNQTAQLFEEPLQTENVPRLEILAAEVATTFGVQAMVYDAQGLVVAASDGALVGQTVTAVPLPTAGLAVQLQAPDNAASTVHFFETAVDDNTAPGFFLLRDETVSRPAAGGLSANNAYPPPGPLFIVNMEMTQPYTLPVDFTAVAMPPPDILINANASQDAYLTLVNRAFFVAMIVSLLVAVLLSYVVSRRILRPVQALTAATRQMGQGDLSARVPVKGRDELAELGQSFNQMAEDLAQQEQLRRNLVTDVAHELLTPLTAVRGHLEAVQDGVLEPTPELINSLHDEVMLLDELIAELQELSLAEAGQLHLDLQPVSLVEVIMGAVTAVKPQITAHILTLRPNLPADLPLVELDARRMGQVFRNLLGNAIKHTPPGGEITITAWHDGAELLVRVRDTGEGIAPEHLPHIFDRFYRADRSRARATGGAGLGLAIVKGVVEAHHGRVWAESEPGVGSAFTINLPVH